MYEESTDKKLVRLPFNQYDGLLEIQIGTIEMINYSGLWRCMYVCMDLNLGDYLGLSTKYYLADILRRGGRTS